jgi:5-methylthioadenosine/S-adenosylhomocysteine deaminase
MFSEIHLAALLPKGLSGDPTAMPAKTAFSLATSSGARAIHQSERIGSLTVGKQADLIVVSLGALHNSPSYTYAADAIYNQLVYTCHASDVRDTIVAGRILMRNRELLTLDEQAILREARRISDDINTFLANREEHLLDKILAISPIQASEIFEVQVKAKIDPADAITIRAILNAAPFTVIRQNQRTQYDTYFVWNDSAQGRIRLREDHRIDAHGRTPPYYTLTLTEPAKRVEYNSAVQLSRARYTAPAHHTERFYREYFQPNQVITITKDRERLHITYRDTEFAVNIDTVSTSANAGMYVELKSRTWSQRDATHKAALMGEILQLFGIDDSRLIKHEYVEQQ